MKRYDRLMRRLYGSEGPAAESAATPDTRLGKYELVREIARGGMGIVYEAEDTELRRRVALKVLREDADDPAVLSRLRREASIAARLRHPNIINVHEVAEVPQKSGGSIHFIAMDFIEGTTLGSILGEGTNRTKLLQLLEEVARAVGYAHSQGVVHRDLKPANVLVDSTGRAVLTDFGLARSESFQSRLTRSQSVLGTPQYMAPEQVEGRSHAVDARTDVYALGVMLYEILTGRLPFRGQTPAKLYQQILRDDPPSPSRIRRGIEPELDWICAKAMEKRPARRYADGREFADDLERFRKGEPVRARRPSWTYRLQKWSVKRRGILVAAAMAASVTVAMAPKWVRDARTRREQERERAAQGERELARSRAIERARPHLEAGRRTVEQMRFRMRDWDSSGHELHALAEAAEAEFRNALADFTELPEAYLGIAQAHAAIGEAAEAFEALDRAVKISPRFATAYLDRARLRAQLLGGIAPGEEMDRRRAEIEADLEKVRQHSPDLTERSCAEGLLAVATEDYELGQRKLTEYLGTAPSDWVAHWSLSTAFYHLGRLKEAEEELSNALKGCARNSVLLCARGQVRSYLGRFDDALADFKRAASVGPLDAYSHFEWGNAILQKGDSKGALSEYAKALEMDSTLVEALASRGAIREESGDSDGALRDYEEAIRLDPRFGDAYAFRGQLRLDRGDAKGALEDFARALEYESRGSNPVHKDHVMRVHFQRGTIHLEAGHLDEAIADFTKAIETGSPIVEVYVNRGMARRLKGDLDGAVADCTAAIQMDPRCPHAYRERAPAYVDLRDWDRAIADYTKKIELCPDDADAYCNRAELYRAKKVDFKSAIADATRALDLDPRLALAYRVRALSRERTGDRQGAAEDARKAIDLSLDDSSRRTMEDLLRRVR